MIVSRKISSREAACAQAALVRSAKGALVNFLNSTQISEISSFSVSISFSTTMDPNVHIDNSCSGMLNGHRVPVDFSQLGAGRGLFYKSMIIS